MVEQASHICGSIKRIDMRGEILHNKRQWIVCRSSAIAAMLVCFAVSAVFFSCKKKDDIITPPVEPPNKQKNIYWPSLADSPWPMGHHDPQSTGRSSYVAAPTGNLAWYYGDKSVSSGIVLDADGTLYYEAKDSSTTYTLYALHPSGRLKWKAELGTSKSNLKNYTNPIISSGGVIYVISLDGNLYAISRDGTRNWFFRADSLILTRGLAIDRSGNLYFVSESGALYSLTPAGNVRYRKTVPQGFWNRETGPPIVFAPDGNTVYVGGYKSGLYALSVDGDIQWQINQATSDFYALRMVDNQGNIYTTWGDTLFSIKPDGTVRWKYTEAGSSPSATIDLNGNIYIVRARTQSLVSLSHEGAYRWEYAVGNIFDGDLVCDGENTVYVYTEGQKTLFAVRSDGTLKWQKTLDTYVDFSSSPAISSDGTIYFPSGSNSAGEAWGIFAFR